MSGAKLKAHHAKVLQALDYETQPLGAMCVPFRVLTDASGISDVREIRRIVRHLARKGLAEFHFPLWNDDGEPAGAGYCISVEGRALIEREAAAS